MVDEEVLPLDRQRVSRPSSTINSVSSDTLPALHAEWKKPIQFVVYLPPPELNVRLADPGKWEAWQERIVFIEEDLHWLLKLPHDKFWSQAVYDETLHKCLDSYLRYAPRGFDRSLDLTGEFLERHNNVHKLVFLACLRMSTHKESKEHFITPSFFGHLIYDHFIFDVPKLMDIAVLYGGDNLQLVQKMVENIFKQQPKYHDDLRSAFSTLINVFKTLKEKCGCSDETATPPPLTRAARPTSPLQSLTESTESEFRDVVLYVADVAFSLRALLLVFPSAADALFALDFHFKLPAFHEAVVPTLRDAHAKRRWADPELRDFLREKVKEARIAFGDIFHQSCQTHCVQPILSMMGSENPDFGRVSSLVDEYIQALTSCLNYRDFVVAHESRFSVGDDLDLFTQVAGAYCDKMHIDFIINGFKSSVMESKVNVQTKDAVELRLFKSSTSQVKSRDDDLIDAVAKANHVVNVDATEPKPGVAVVSREVAGVELDSLISNVRDILPDLGEGFIEAALEEYGYDSAAVVDAVLEDSLGPRLRNMDRANEKRKPSKPLPPPSYEETRRNVYEDAGFEGLKDFHVGKRETAKNVKALLDDKKDLQRSRYAAYGDVDVGSGSLYDEEKVYDDEYDDTYDDNLVGAEDADDVDELGDDTGRKFVQPKVLQQQQQQQRGGRGDDDDDDGEEDEPEENLAPWKRPGNTLGIEDPAVLRERAAQRRAARGGRGRGGGVTGGGGPSVTGNPKGQGQDKSTEIARKRKDAHKASRANHNRKSQAGRKQARGMF